MTTHIVRKNVISVWLLCMYMKFRYTVQYVGSSGWLGSRLVSVLDSGRVQIVAATLSGNSLRQTVHTHRASVHQAAKLVAALLRVARVSAGLAESNGSSGTLRSAIEYGLPSMGYLYLFMWGPEKTVHKTMMNKYVGPPCSRTRIYAVRMSRDSSSYRSMSAARARPQQQTRRPPLLLSIDGTDRRTKGHWTVV